jgi:hypothetical protein
MVLAAAAVLVVQLHVLVVHSRLQRCLKSPKWLPIKEQCASCAADLLGW